MNTDLSETLTRSLERQVLEDCGQYVPYRSGYLCSTGHTTGDGYVIWDAPYASECYYAERAFSKKHHPLACAHWFEAAKSAHIREWEAGIASMFGAGSLKKEIVKRGRTVSDR